jgi:hypothetical protein
VSFQPVEPSLGLQFTVVVFLVALVSRTHLLGCLVLGMVYGIVQAVLGYLLDPTTGATLTLVVFLVALIGERVVESLTYIYRRLASGSRKTVSEAA